MKQEIGSEGALKPVGAFAGHCRRIHVWALGRDRGAYRTFAEPIPEEDSQIRPVCHF